MTSQKKKHPLCRFIAIVVILAFSLPLQLAAAERRPISVFVNASDSGRKLFHSELAIPVQPGPITLVYPRWGIPSYQLPTMGLSNMIRLKMTANGRSLGWKRDLMDMFSFHVVVPNDVSVLNVVLDVIAPAHRFDLNAATANLFVLDGPDKGAASGSRGMEFERQHYSSFSPQRRGRPS